MADVFEHQPRGGRDVDFLGGDAESFHQPPGIRLGIVRGGEAGQGIAANIAARTPQPVHRLGCDDQRMRAVEAARDTDGQAFRPGCLDPPHERIDLDVERLVAVLVELIGAVGHEGEPPDRAVEADIGARRGALECDPPIPVLGPSGGLGGIVEGLHTHPLGQDALRIDIGDAQFGCQIEAHAFGHQIAQLVDHPLPVPREVGSAFAMPAGRIGIGADRPARACAAEQMAFVRLADDDIRRRKVEQDRRTRQRGHGAGRIGRPEILTDLDAKGEPRQIVRGEDQISTERYLTGATADRQADAFAAMREPALFVIFAIVGQEALGYHAEQFAPRDDQRAIVDPAIAAQRRPEDQHRA